ncbi:MAG TPA: hypothetical protein VK797_19685, partial [Tepidisphaeraceae bacterium]|nr:hypothetical protein [Tepidisphaeraceae bacterium]
QLTPVETENVPANRDKAVQREPMSGDSSRQFNWKTQCRVGCEDFLLSSHVKSLLPKGRFILVLMLVGVASWFVLIVEALARHDAVLIAHYVAFIVGGGVACTLLTLLSYCVSSRRRSVVFGSERIQMTGFRPRDINRVELKTSGPLRLVFFTTDAAVIVVKIPPHVSLLSIESILGEKLKSLGRSVGSSETP